jgi:hypothetical protein
MATNDYFKSVLAAQTPTDDSPEMNELQTNRAAVEKVLREGFPGASATIRYGGSTAKGTLILESYDLDIVFYVPNANNTAGETLKEIFGNVKAALAKHYAVEPKTSALRLRSTDRRSDLHIDVVPGRFTDDSKTDCYLHQANGNKDRLKTNLDVHIKHIRDSGVLDALRLLKLLRVRRAIQVKQFAYELLGVQVLKGKRRSIEEQLDYFCTEIANSEQSIAIEDPANPGGNDLSVLLKTAWPGLRQAARAILQQAKTSGWEGVIGKPSAVPATNRAPRLEVIRQSTSSVTIPWAE